MTLLLLFTAVLMESTALNAQQSSAAIDVTDYRFSVALSEQSDTIMGEATIKLKVIKPTKSVSFDLTSLQADGKGMSVLSVSGNSPFTHQKNVLTIQSGQMQVGDVKEYTIAYKGIPADGLIIGKNKYGKKVFFADHWPDRARNWLPCVDHPADKAEVVFIVTAPTHYQVVANGIQKEETSLGENMKRTRYEESIPLPTKVMVIGVADFAVQYAGDAGPVPVFSWVYPEERENGFYDFAQALDILPFFINKIGPYGYRKLANVQSKTRFGGLENANTIFYHENSITGTRTTTSLLAHEIAHQWFGNMVTEKEWAHVWLSEGFATYLTTCFMEETYGKDTALQMRREDREQVIAFARKDKRPVVDNAVTDYMQLLNANSYQKGGWILHMLRKEVGDSTFWHILQRFYENYKGKNADTEDLLKVANQVSKRDYSAFFRQWLYQSGVPLVELSWTYDSENRQVSLAVKQLQDGLFQFPLAMDFLSIERQSTKRITISITQKEENFKIDMPFDPTKLIVDPEVDLLFSATIINR